MCNKVCQACAYIVYGGTGRYSGKQYFCSWWCMCWMKDTRPVKLHGEEPRNEEHTGVYQERRGEKKIKQGGIRCTRCSFKMQEPRLVKDKATSRFESVCQLVFQDALFHFFRSLLSTYTSVYSCLRPYLIPPLPVHPVLQGTEEGRRQTPSCVFHISVLHHSCLCTFSPFS